MSAEMILTVKRLLLHILDSDFLLAIVIFYSTYSVF